MFFLISFIILIDFSLKRAISKMEYVQDESVGTDSDVDESRSDESASYSSATPDNHGVFLLPGSFCTPISQQFKYCVICLRSFLCLFQTS